MNNATLVETLRPLPRASRVRLSDQVDRLRRVCDGDQELEPFLEEVLDVLGRMFGASAAAFWFHRLGTEGVSATVRWGIANRPEDPGALADFDGPIAIHWNATAPVSQTLPNQSTIILIGPIRDSGGPVGAVQLILPGHTAPGSGSAGGSAAGGSASEELPPPAGSAESTLETGHGLYRRALGGLLGIVQPALLRRLPVRTLALRQADEGMDALSQQIAGIQRSIRIAIEHYLQQWSGATFGSLEENQRFVRGMQKLLDGHGLRVRCPECGHPSILRCSRNASVPGGVFVFDHYLPQGRTFHGGGRTLPAMRITSKPARRQSS